MRVLLRAVVFTALVPSLFALEEGSVPNLLERTKTQVQSEIGKTPFQCVFLNLHFEGKAKHIGLDDTVRWQYPTAFSPLDIRRPVLVILGPKDDPKTRKPISGKSLYLVGDDADDAFARVDKLLGSHKATPQFLVVEARSGQLRLRTEGWERLRVVAQYPPWAEDLRLTPTDPIAVIAVPYTTGKLEGGKVLPHLRGDEPAVAVAAIADRRRRPVPVAA